MCFSTDEIHQLMFETIEQLTIASSCRVNPKPHLEADDDDYLFLDDNLDRWGDRRVPKDNGHPMDQHSRLEREADLILASH